MPDDFAQLQAILAGLPMHAVPQPLSLRSCVGPDMLVQCSGQRMHPPQLDSRTCAARVEDALRAIRREYPDHGDVLDNLVVVYASLDLVCLADHMAQRLYTAARGTDRNLNPLTTPRDWTNNLMIAFGSGPHHRTIPAVYEYRAAKELYPSYESFGSGHSLGGAVVLHLAKAVEVDPALSFKRVDVFNTAVSPLSRSLVAINATSVHLHRVDGDVVSLGLRWMSLSEVHVHPVKPHLRERHALGHFLPNKASERLLLDSEPEVAGTQSEPVQGTKRPTPPPDNKLGLLWAFTSLSCVGSRSKAPKPYISAAPTRAPQLAMERPAAAQPPPEVEVEAVVCDLSDAQPLSRGASPRTSGGSLPGPIVAYPELSANRSIGGEGPRSGVGGAPRFDGLGPVRLQATTVS